jgi:hypothetical protein
MALRRNLEGLASLFPPSQRPYKPWLKDDLVRDSIPQDDLASLLQGLGGTGTTGPLGGPLGGPSSVGIDLPRRIPTGSFFSNLPTSPPGSIFDLLGGGTAEQTIGGDQIFGPPDIGTVPPPPQTVGPGPETAPVDQGSTISPLPDQSQPQPPSKAQRIRQLKAQVRALEDQIRQIMLQIRELQGGERPLLWEAPPGIGMNPPPTPPTPWKPPLGG